MSKFIAYSTTCIIIVHDLRTNHPSQLQPLMYNVPAHDEDKKIFCDVFLKILPSNLRALLSNTHPTIFRQLLTDLVATHLGDGRARQVVVGELAERHQHQRHLVVRPVKVREEVETGLTRCGQRPAQYWSTHALNTYADTSGSEELYGPTCSYLFSYQRDKTPSL